MIAGLLDEPYCKSEEQIKNLTMRQIVLIYYRKRDKYGVPRRIEDQWYEPGDEKADRKTFIELGLLLGKNLQDLEAEWAKATNGKP